MKINKIALDFDSLILYKGVNSTERIESMGYMNAAQVQIAELRIESDRLFNELHINDLFRRTLYDEKMKSGDYQYRAQCHERINELHSKDAELIIERTEIKAKIAVLMNEIK